MATAQFYRARLITWEAIARLTSAVVTKYGNLPSSTGVCTHDDYSSMYRAPDLRIVSRNHYSVNHAHMVCTSTHISRYKFFEDIDEGTVRYREHERDQEYTRSGKCVHRRPRPGRTYGVCAEFGQRFRSEGYVAAPDPVCPAALHLHGDCCHRCWHTGSRRRRLGVVVNSSPKEVGT